ncbi:unnamed protein product [Cuscuta campestris]|uniref:Uncharacterized protein n=1 Tax=Cuscuta campestris TaxID=132261 RepID=A0A484KMM8_9ASTE|nr:unnamed protein product [Cuscuta campestris]
MDEKVEGDDKEFVDYGIAGHIRKTVYGPATSLPRRLRRYRVMNRSEYAAYNKKVNKSGGYDVDGCSGSIPGRIFPVLPTSCDWEPAELAAQFAALKQAEDGNSDFHLLLHSCNAPIRVGTKPLELDVLPRANLGCKPVFQEIQR